MTYDSIGDIPVTELAHYGVKGMKWGVRKDRSGSGVKKPRRPPEKVSSAQIRGARGRHAARVGKIWEADANVRLATTKKGKAAALKEVEKWGKEIASSDDTRIAAKMTGGEKFATLLVGTIILPGVGTAAGAAAIGANAVKTRRRN